MRSVVLGPRPSEATGVQEQEPAFLFYAVQVPIVGLEILFYRIRVLVEGNVESRFALKGPAVEILDGEGCLSGTRAPYYQNAFSFRKPPPRSSSRPLIPVGTLSNTIVNQAIITV